MTDREKVALVAEKVMGWTVNRSERGWHTIGVTPKRLIGPSKCRLPGDCWNPWERIEHAWEVVEEMEAGGWRFVLQSGVQRPEYTHRVDFHDDARPFVSDGHHVAGGMSAPDAICRCALRAKGVEV